MDSVQAVILALIQGLTEFLPISSSAHLILPAQVLGWTDQGLAFDVAVHVGTLFAIVLYFRRQVYELSVAWLGNISGRGASEESRLAWLLILATIPAGLLGLLLDDLIEAHLRSSFVIACTTIIFGLVLLAADKKGARSRLLEAMTWRAALVIGFSQALALIPGTSRSGITMTAALFLGFTRDAAARFSFLMSIPLIAAAGLLKTKELVETGTPDEWDFVILGTLVAFGSAYLCIHLFLAFLERIGFMPFVIYRLLLGAVLFMLLWSGA